jgi:uncharacterized protein
MEQQGQQVSSFITGSSMPTQDEKTWGMLSHLSGLLLAFIGPLIIWQTKGKESAWVERQAIEALNFQITIAIAFVASFILTFVVIGACLMPLVGLGALVLSIIAGIKANNGEVYRYPVTLRLIK